MSCFSFQGSVFVSGPWAVGVSSMDVSHRYGASAGPPTLLDFRAGIGY